MREGVKEVVATLYNLKIDDRKRIDKATKEVRDTEESGGNKHINNCRNYKKLRKR